MLCRYLVVPDELQVDLLYVYKGSNENSLFAWTFQTYKAVSWYLLHTRLSYKKNLSVTTLWSRLLEMLNSISLDLETHQVSRVHFWHHHRFSCFSSMTKN